MDPLVSVYVPTRNRRLLLARAITSVLRQDYQALELIVVNDASTDDTKDYLDQLAATEPRLTVLHQTVAGGAPAARNRAIAVARGAFITGLDDDDEFLPNRLSLFVRTWQSLRDRERHSCLFTPLLTSRGEEPIPSASTAAVMNDGAATVAYLDLFDHNGVGNQVFCPAERYRDVGGFDEEMPAWQDLELFIRLLKRYGDAVCVPQPTYVCYVDEGRDRLSANHKNRRIAFDRISAKYPTVPPLYHQRLYLQMFSPFYGLMPSWTDFRYLALGRRSWGLMLKLAITAIRIKRRR